MDLKVLVLPGDGIGTEVTREAVRVLRYVASKWNHNLTLTEGLLGGVAIHRTGTPFPDARNCASCERKSTGPNQSITACTRLGCVALASAGSSNAESVPVTPAMTAR